MLVLEKSTAFYESYNQQNSLAKSQSSLKQNIIEEVGPAVYEFLEKHVNLSESNSFTTATTNSFNIRNLTKDDYKQIINLNKLNDARYINKFLELINSKLSDGGLYVNCVQTYALRRKTILSTYKKPLCWIYYVADVLFMRVFPKLHILKNIYFFITKGRNRVIHRSEVLGRLYSCGFEILAEQVINNKLYFVARKIKAPVFDYHASYGPIIRLKRVGKEGELFNVYKLRTMYPYSEYLQEYIHQHNSLKEGGKFNNDFRISTEGKIFRKFWLDEIPMLLNFLKGDMKLVGVRPLSPHYFSLYSSELQNKRKQHKVGLIPPYYADMPKNLDEVMASEMCYLEAYEKNPVRTNVKYFFKASYNIFIKRARSS
jgi:lipopolysaccharide/colanic/teichoic acid biosynthesis glycosyltransferase